MKKLIYGGLFLTTLGIGFVACKKKSIEQNQETGNLIYKLDKIDLIDYKPQNEFYKNNSDDDEKKLDGLLVLLAEATKVNIKDGNFSKKILKIAEKSNTGTVYYSEIKTTMPNIYNEINQRLAVSNTSIEDITSKMTHSPILPNPEFPETGQLEIYEPAIYVPNVEIADKHLQALISPNIEVQFNEEDCIVAWYYEQSGVQKETIISEKTSIETTNPIFILNHAIPKSKMDLIGDFYEKTKKGNGIPKTTTYFESTKIQIKNGYRYESGLGIKSEYCIGGAIVRLNEPPVNFLHLTGNNDQSLKIKEVKKSDIESSTLLNVTSNHIEQNLTPYSNNKVYWNTFERDWNRPLQDFGNGTTYTQPWYVAGNARYANDWYTWIPNTVNIHATPFEWFGWVNEIPYDNWKSFYNIVKVN